MGSKDSDSPRDGSEARVSRATAVRLSLYLRRLEASRREGAAKFSSGQLGEAVGVTDAQVRKDLASLGMGSLGQPGIGYPTHELIGAIRKALGIDREWRVALVGAGNLARALLHYRGFEQRGFRVVALFDADATKVGQVLDGLEVHGPERMAEVIAASGAELGMVA